MGKLAVYPGSFDPITLGHLDIIKRTSKLFDKLIVVVMCNYRKKNTNSFTPMERAEFINRCVRDLPNVAVDFYDGLLADYVKDNHADVIVKGLRAVTDFEDEFQQALTNKHLAPSVETMFMVTAQENMYMSSSLVKQLCELGADISDFVPEEICSDVTERLFKRKD